VPVPKSRLPSKLIYIGRAYLDEGVFDWIEIFSIVAKRNIDLTATWFGGGSELAATQNAQGKSSLLQRSCSRDLCWTAYSRDPVRDGGGILKPRNDKSHNLLRLFKIKASYPP
jgi:hypothetical protein